jgi:hypothetical protein
VPSKSVGAIDVDKSGYVSRDDDTDDPDGQGSERQGSDSDACDPGEDDGDGLGSERKGSDNDTDDPDGQGSDRKGDDGDSERLLQEYQAIAGVKAPGPASNINPEKLEADDTQNLQNLRQQPRRYPARSSQKIPSSVNSKDVDKTGTLYRTVISLPYPYPYPYRYPDPYPYPLPLPSRTTHVTSP